MTYTFFVRIKLLAKFLLLFTLAIGCMESVAESDPKTYQSSPEKVFTNYLDNLNSQGLAVLVAKNGEIYYQKAYGFADRHSNIENTTSTKFQIGSMTKQFTAMGIMILREQGKVNLNAILADYLEECPAHWASLTIHQLLTHTSGLMHSWEHPEFNQITGSVKTLDELLAFFKDEPLKAEPGTTWRYSGLGYFILAKVIEIQSGKSWNNFMHSEIFDPLDMTNTGTGITADRAENLASGYIQNGDTYQKAPYTYMPILTGGGDIYSTVQDLFKWDQALSKQELISENSYSTMFTPELNNYAYGWFVDSDYQYKRIHHSGGVPGFFSNIVRYPDLNLMVVVLSNATTSSTRVLTEFPRLALQELK